MEDRIAFSLCMGRLVTQKRAASVPPETVGKAFYRGAYRYVYRVEGERSRPLAMDLRVGENGAAVSGMARLRSRSRWSAFVRPKPRHAIGICDRACLRPATLTAARGSPVDALGLLPALSVPA